MNSWPKKCVVKFCRKRVYQHQHRSKCGKHHTLEFKERHPLKYYFNKLKQRAKERGVAFKLTFAQYAAFAVSSGYQAQRGKEKFSLSIDRRENDRGYEMDNIQALTLSENASKSNRKNWVPFFNSTQPQLRV